MSLSSTLLKTYNLGKTHICRQQFCILKFPYGLECALSVCIQLKSCLFLTNCNSDLKLEIRE